MFNDIQRDIMSVINADGKCTLDSNQLVQLSVQLIEKEPNQIIIHDFLDMAHSREVVKIIANSDQIDIWFKHLVSLISLSNYHFGYMLKQRAHRYEINTALNFIEENNIRTISYSILWIKVTEAGKSLSTFETINFKPNFGILCNNQLNSAIIDLACLSFGYRVIPIPLNSTPENISYIIKHSKISHLFIGGETGNQLWNKVKTKHDTDVICLESQNSPNKEMLDWENFISLGDQLQNFEVDERLSKVSMKRVQTIMYTSGTTANPKGITFNQINMITKRFARGIALPDIGPDDVFLCYLPLFHTFGRYFELMGSIFWGATYSFARSPAFNSLLKDFKLIKPTIFISIPKRWVQLYELLDSELDLDSDDSEIILSKIKSITGGNLKWGLSAAGYLDPDIFSLLQSHHINLLSGYGMTEATGGITMTPPHEYVKDSVGKALPGIELRLAEDRELCLRGPYVTEGYYNEENSETFSDGWFYTEDIFEEIDGHYYIIDRKKDIYKNSRGQTISPQKIENLFQDFDSVKSVYLVGDGREFNTVMIYPDYKNSPLDINSTNSQAVRDMFSSMILSVNSFLSPFERIVNYVIINRDFSFDKGELTTKGSYKRKKVLENFQKIINPLYEKNYVSLFYNSKEIKFPNWLLREIGTVRTNIKWDGQKIAISDHSGSLLLSWKENIIKIGDFIYTTDSDVLDLESLIKCPSLWLGNFNFSDFTGPSIFRLKEAEPYDSLQIDNPLQNNSLENVKADNKIDTLLYQIHVVVRQYISGDSNAFERLKTLIDGELNNWGKIIIDTFLHYQDHSNPIFRIKLTETLAPLLSGDFLISMIHSAYHFQREKDISKGFSFDIMRTNDEHYQSFINYLKKAHRNIKEASVNEHEFVKTLLLFISDFGTVHPTRFIWARSELIWWQLSDIPKPLFSTAQKAYFNLIKGFRSWIGKSRSITVSPDTGKEYDWNDVVTFDDNVRDVHKKRLMESIQETSIIRESIFLFSQSSIVDLNDIPKKGIWIRHLGSRNRKSVFRILIKTRSYGAHNIVVNLNEGWDKKFLDDETKWLITMSSGLRDQPLVENFGGYWPEYGLYTEEYIQGETLSEYLKRNKDDINDKAKLDRWQMQWLHFIWNGVLAYQEFWSRTNFKLSIQPPSPENLIIPRHDYKTGTRLISISGRKKTSSFAEHFISIFTEYIILTEKKYPGLKHMSDWEVIFTATIQATKMEQGKWVLNELKLELKDRPTRKKCELVGLTVNRIDDFIEDIDKYGILTKPVVFASLRYERWLELNPEATLQARASILQELYNDYRLDELLEEYPETRIRFFMMTCFKEKNIELLSEFQSIIIDLRNKNLSPWNIQERISNLKSKVQLTKDNEFFLARMLFPHIDAADYVELITTSDGEETQLDLVFQTECSDGNIYQIRPPFLPKEIANFHSLLSESALAGTFISGHEFLLAFNKRDRLVGGLYWKKMESERAHLEWVAVRKNYQKISLSKRLMSDFYKRMIHKGFKVITVGFYVEKFFFKQGFKIDKQYGGLVKKL